MHAIEFEATPVQHTIHVPESVPEGIKMRVLLLWETPAQPAQDLKKLFVSVVEGLSDEELARPVDLGRGDPSWDICSTPSWMRWTPIRR